MLEIRSSIVSLPTLSAVQLGPVPVRPTGFCRPVTACAAVNFGSEAAALESVLRGSQRAAFARQTLESICRSLDGESR